MATTRIQYSREQLREIEKFVVANPKKYLQQKAAPVARPAGSSEVIEQRRASRFERPAGYQGRLGRDRDTETFEEGYQYELASRQNAPPPSSSSLTPPTQSPPPAAVVETKQPEPVAAPLPAVANIGNEFDDLPPVVAPVGTRKSRFTFASTDAAAAPTAPAALPPKQPQPQPQPQTVPVYGYQQPVPLPVQQPQYQQRPVAAVNQPHYYAAGAQPVAMPEPPKPQQQQQQRQFVPAPQQYTQPPPAVVQPAAAPLGSFTVQAANTVPTSAKPQHQQHQQQYQHNAPQTASGELDVVAALQRQGVNTNSLHHQGGRGGGQQQQQQRGNGGNAYQQQGRHANHSTVAPPDPAVVSFNASPNQAANSTPPALQALFSASRNHAAVPTGVPAGAVVDAAALEAALLGGQRPASGGNNNNNNHHHHGGGGQRGGRRR